MKGNLTKFKKIKFAILSLGVIFFSLFAPVSLNHSQAADPIKVIEVTNNNISGLTQWVTESFFNSLNPGEWTKTGASQLVDPSLIQGGVLPAATGWSFWSIPEKIFSFLIKALLAFVYFVLWCVYSLLYGITMLAEKILEMVLDPTFSSKNGYLGGFTTKQFVRDAAQLLANLCNMLYLFVLIYIGLRTMFGGSFGKDISTKNLLTKLIIAALLTNFGLVFAGVIIDFSQVIMYTVWDGIKGSSGAFEPGTKILNQLQESFGAGKAAITSDIFSDSLKFLTLPITYVLTELIKIAGLIVISLALVVTLISISIILLVRIAALWVLLILTPIAFLFSILPQTNKYWNQWLEALTKYAFTGPILIFFLWLGLKLAQTIHHEPDNNGAVAGLILPGTNSGTAALSGGTIGPGDLKYVFFDFVAKNLSIVFEMGIVIVTIWAGIIIANKFGIKGAKSWDGLIKSTAGLGKGLANYIPWYGGRAATWGSLFFGKFASGMSQRRSAQADLARSTAKNKEELKKAEALENKANWWTNKEVALKKRKDQIVKGFSVMNPLIVKKQFAAWWNKNSKEHMEQSEAAVDEFGQSLVRTITFGRLTERGKTKMATEAKINNIDKAFADKYKEITPKEAEIETVDNRLTAAQTIMDKNTHDLESMRPKEEIEKDLEQKKVQLASYNDSASKAKTSHEKMAFSPGIDRLNQEIKVLEVEKDNREKLEGDLQASTDDYNKLSENKKVLEDQKEKIMQELNGFTSSIADLYTKDIKEIDKTKDEGINIIKKLGGKPLPQDYKFSENLSETLNLRGKNSIIEKAKKIAGDDTIELMTKHIWQEDQKEKKIKEEQKKLEDKRYTFEQLEDMAKSGYGDAITRTAIFRRLASSPKNFGNLLAKTLKDYNNQEQEALNFLKQRYSDEELQKAFSAAEIEARKSNNLYSMGWLKHDTNIGKLRLIRGNERSVNLANFAKGMTPDKINNIHPQSFNDPEAVKQMALNFDWKKLARNPRFVDGMSQNTRTLFKNKQKEFEDNMSAQDQEAFRTIIKV